MTSAPFLMLFVDSVALLVTAFSAYYVYRQQGSPYHYLRGLLIVDHALFGGVLVLEIVRALDPAPAVLVDYTILATGFILASVMVLSFASLVVYYRPGAGRFIDFLRTGVVARTFGGIGSMAMAAYIVAVFAYFVLFRPFAVVQLESVFGGTVATTVLSFTFQEMLLGVFLLFTVNPLVLLVRARNSVKESSTREALTALPLSWAAIGISFLLFRGYLGTAGIEASPIGYLMASLAFGLTANIYRRASLFASFFEPVDLQLKVGPSSPFLKRLNVQEFSFQHMDTLMEVDASVNYEEAVKDYAVEAMAKGDLVFVFTSKTSPVYRGLSELTDVRFYTMSGRVSYPKQATGSLAHEMLVPQNDAAILLDLVDRTVKSKDGHGIVIIFDSISDVLLNFKFESAYNFLKIMNEIIYESEATSLFLVTKGAHDPKVLNLVKSLYRNHVVCDADGLRLNRRAQFFPNQYASPAEQEGTKDGHEAARGPGESGPRAVQRQ